MEKVLTILELWVFMDELSDCLVATRMADVGSVSFSSVILRVRDEEAAERHLRDCLVAPREAYFEMFRLPSFAD